jgi:hypothetical protein
MRSIDELRAKRDGHLSQYGKMHPDVILYTTQLQIAEDTLAKLQKRNEKLQLQTPSSHNNDLATAMILELQRSVLSLTNRVLELENEVRALREKLDGKTQ